MIHEGVKGGVGGQVNYMDGVPKLKQKTKFKVKHQKRKLFRANEPFFSVFMWGVNYSVVEVSHANVPVMLLPDDFKSFMKVKVELQHFNQDIMPSHYKFKVYCPLVFKAFRDIFQISDRQWKYSLTNRQLSITRNREKVWLSHDQKFIVRSISGEDVANLHGILSHLHKHYIECRGKTLLPMFVGLFRLFVNDKQVYLLVSKHIFDTPLPLHEIYSIKGSTVDRFASEKERLLDPPMLKDNDFILNNRKIHVGPEAREVLLERLKHDTDLLAQLNIMDYSMLIGIHDCSAPMAAPCVAECHPAKEEEGQAALSPSEARGEEPRPEQATTEYVEDSDLEEDLSGVDNVQSRNKSRDNDSMSRHDSIVEKNEIYFLGLTDILTFYGTRKKTYHLAKTAKYGAEAEISNVRPEQYAKRMIDFLSRTFV